ncbi:MAG: protein kinase, partial [Pseudomonadota bacterium]
HHYLVTPHYAGGSLQQRIQEGPVLIADAITIARQLCEGLAAAHARDIVHRDIKPANLLFDAHGTLKIADFGIAKLVGATDLTRTGAVMGTPAYQSPEQSRGSAVDHRTDVWSAGVVLFEMLSGRRPFDGDFDPAVRQAVETARPEARETLEGQSIPEDLRAIVSRAMAKRPADRYPDAQSMADALLRLGPDGRVPVVPPPARPPSRLWLMAGLTAVLLAMVIGRVWFALDTSEEGCLAGLPDVQRSLELGQRALLEGNNTKSLEEAEAHFGEAVRRAPRCGEALGNQAILLAELADLERSAKRREAAWEVVETAEDRGLQQDFRVRIARGQLLLQVGQVDEAEKILRPVFEGWTSCAEYQSCDLSGRLLAEALWRQARREGVEPEARERLYAEAESVLKRCAEIGGGRIRCALKTAQLREVQREFTQAEIIYDQLNRDYPRQTTVFNDLGVLQLERGMSSDALHTFDELIKIAPDDPRAWLNHGHAHYNQGSYAAAIKSYEESKRLFVEKDELHEGPDVSIGDALLELGDVDQAMVHFELALSIYNEKRLAGEPDRPGPRAVCLAKLGRVAEALAALRPLLKEFPNNGWVHLYAARVYALEGSESELRKHAAAALRTGIPRSKLTQDAAFRAYRQDPEYTSFLASISVED